MLEIADVCLAPDAASSQQNAGFSHVFTAGEITVVLGANQSGKTDLCRLIAGLNTRATGQVTLGGEDLTGVPTRKRPVSMVYQAFVNYPNLTVAQNIASPLRARAMASNEVAARVTDLAERLAIGDLLQRFPHELSGGQQQRLAIARALAKEAPVLLLDEPLVNLDFKLREALELELRELLHASQTVVLYTSSDPRDAFSLGDRLLLLDKGHKLQAGTPMQLYRMPDGARAMELLADPGVNYFEQHGRRCGLRPEHVRLGEAVVDSDSMRFDMAVTACETNGDESFVHGRVGQFEWVVRCPGITAVKPGESLTLSASNTDVVRL